MDDDPTGTNCIACNRPGAEQYQIRLHRRDGTHTDMEPTFCDTCASEHLEFEWIEPQVTVDGTDRPSQ